MTYLANKLKHRIEIRKAIQTPNDAGGHDRSYETLLTIWGGVEPLKHLSARGGAYIRGVNSDQDSVSHKFTFRKIALATLGRGFGTGFGDGFDGIADLNTLKSEYFLFMKKSGVKGKLFRVKHIKNDTERDEFLTAMAEEIEEHGTGYSA